MNPYLTPLTNRTRFSISANRWLFLAGAFLLLALLIVAGMEARVLHADTSIIHSTTNDFVKGTFYATGLHNVAGSDGEVQLLPVGFTDNWIAENPPSALPSRAELAAVSYNNILYAIAGGSINTGFLSDIYSATTTISGTIVSGWSLADDLGEQRAGHAAVISTTASGGVMYIVGGFNNGNIGTGFNTILYKTINTSGAITAGAWNTFTMPSGLKYPAAVVRHGYLYVIGGSSAGLLMNTIYRFPITNSSGALGSPVTYSMPNDLEKHGAVIWSSPNAQDYLYILGGVNDSGATSIVNYVPFNPDDSLPNLSSSSWVTRTLVDAFSAHGAIQSNNNVHVIGGAKSIGANDFVSQVQSALIDLEPVEGALHDWTGSGLYWIVTSPLAEARAYHGTAVNMSGYVYVLGGYDKNGNATSTVYRGNTTGVAPFHAPYGNYTNVFDTGVFSNTLTSLKWTTWVTGAHTLTMRYRTGNSTTSWSSWMSATNSITGLNTLTLPNIQNRYLQYQLLYTTTISSTTPLLRDVQLDYRPPPTVTPTTTTVTVTVPPVTPGARLPDLILSALDAPVSSSLMTYTVNVSVTNWGVTGFNRLPSTLTLSKTARSVQITGKPGVPRRIPDSLIRAAKDYTGTTNYFVWVDVYVDPTTIPTNPGIVGNCPTQGGGTNYALVYALGVGEIINVPIDCYLTQGSHQYYAQVDTCDNPPNVCSPVYGYVSELTDLNNIAGPVTSGQKWQGVLGWLNPIFLPRSSKSQ